MRLALVSLTTHPQVTWAWLASVAHALSRQAWEDFGAAWEASGADVVRAASLEEAPKDAFPIVLFDHSDQAGALGYHDVTPDGRPFARIFCDEQSLDGISLTASHELLEVLGDPYASFWADLDFQAGTEVALELCDPVEDQSYRKDGVLVSNFVTPRWFRAGPGPYDWMKKLAAPLTRSDAGYLIVRGANGEVTTDPPMRLAHKLKSPASRTARRHARNVQVAKVADCK